MSLLFYKDNGTEEHIAGLNGQADLVSGKGVIVQNGEVSQTRDQLTFTGTRNEWNSLSLEQKAQYGIANITDDVASGVPIVVDAVTDGDMNPVTSNAVYDFVQVITPTLGPSISGNLRCFKIGKLVIVSGDVVYDGVNELSTLATGLPVNKGRNTDTTIAWYTGTESAQFSRTSVLSHDTNVVSLSIGYGTPPLGTDCRAHIEYSYQTE